MAEFCKECSINMWGRDLGEFSNLISEDKVKEGYGALVCCEGCGVIRVDHTGKRLEESKDE